MLSKEAKYRLKNAKRTELKAVSDAVDLLARYQLLTIKRASAIDRFLERMGGRR